MLRNPIYVLKNLVNFGLGGQRYCVVIYTVYFVIVVHFDCKRFILPLNPNFTCLGPQMLYQWLVKFHVLDRWVILQRLTKLIWCLTIIDHSLLDSHYCARPYLSWNF